MPVKLPTANDLGRRPQLDTLQPIIQDRTAGLVSQANQAVGKAVESGSRTVYLRDAETEISAYKTALDQIEVDLIHNEKDGYKSKKGKDAIDGQDEFREQYKKRVDEAAAKLGNPTARRGAAALSKSRGTQVDSWLNDYVRQQRDVYDDSVYDSSIASARQRVSLDPSKAEDEARNTSVQTLGMARRKGVDPEKALADNLAGIHGAVIDGHMARREYVQAYEYFDKHRASLGDKADDYAARTDAARQLVMTTSKTDEIIGKYGTGEKAFAAAKKIEDPQIRKGVEQAIEHQITRDEALRTRRENIASRTAFAKLEGAPTATALEQVFTPDELVRINQQEGLRARLENRQSSLLQNRARKTEPEYYDTLLTLAAKDPEKFVGQDIDETRLSAPDYVKLKSAQSGPDRATMLATEAELVSAYAYRAGAREKDAKEKFKTAYQAALSDWSKESKNKGRTPSVPEMEEILRPLTRTFQVPGMLFGTNDMAGYNVRFGVSKEAQNIPPELRAEYEAVLRASGKPVTEPNIVFMYSNDARRKKK